MTAWASASRANACSSLLRRGIREPSVIVLGMTFKENVPDIRNSKVVGRRSSVESDLGSPCRFMIPSHRSRMHKKSMELD